jgi:site-specific recombinase XerD
MATPKFYLKGAKKKGDPFWKTSKPALVVLYFSYKKNRVVISTGITIAPALWSQHTKKVKSSATNAEEINIHLEGIASQFMAVYHDLSTDGNIPTPDELRAEYVERSNDANEGKKPVFVVDSYLEYIEDMKGLRADNTIKNYFQTVTHLERYQDKALGGKKLTFADMDMKFYHRFLHHLNHKEGLRDNSAGGIIKLLKSYLRHAFKTGLLNNTAFEDFKVLKVDVPSTYLNLEELQVLADMDLSKTPYLDRTRDMFLVACWSGLRFSDCVKFRREDIQDGMIRIRTEKTSELVTIPVNALVQSILDKYDGQTPPKISNPKMNKYLKTLGKKAGFDTIMTRTKVTAGKKETEDVPRYQMITSHTARRSFATNLYKAGFPIAKLMKITGHKTESAFFKYIKIEKDEAAEDLRDFMRGMEGMNGRLKVVS